MINKIMINKMIKTLLLIFLVFVAPSLSLSAEKPEKPKKISRAENYIAVLELETVGKVEKDVKRPLTDSIRLEIVKSGKWKVIERSNMDKILKEQKFQQACTSTECIVEVGQLLGVGKMIMGSVSMVGKTYYLSLQLVNVESGQIENVSEDKCKCEIDDLIDSTKRLTKKLLGETTDGIEQTTTSSDASTGKDSVAGVEMVFVKGGCFQMGDTFGDGYSDEKPVHEVCVDDFYIGKYEVTQGQWEQIMGNNPSYFKDCGDNCPVEQVSWNSARKFIKILNQKTGKNYKLPTAAEWEYAAKSGGKNEKYAGGNDVDSVAWYTSNSGKRTYPVGQKKPNGLGLYDMSGNVGEWVEDWYDGKHDENSPYYKNSPKNNPTGPAYGESRILRGGSWNESAKNVRTAARSGYSPSSGTGMWGFRLARTP